MDKQERSNAAFACFCAYMDAEGLQYSVETDENGNQRILLGVLDDDTPIDAFFVFETAAERIYAGSILPFTPQEDALDELIMAVLRFNQYVAVGTFCVDPEKRICSYESTETIAGVEHFAPAYAERVIVSTFSVVKKACAALAAVGRGECTADDIELEEGEEEGA